MESEKVASEPAGVTDTPVFLLSFRQRDELASAAASAGWRVVAARRGEGVERRFLSSGANVVVIDARGSLSDGIEAARALGGAVEASGAAMLVLVSQSDTVYMREFYDAGATHFLSSPMSIAGIAHAMRFAQRHAERLGAGQRAGDGADDALGWRYDANARLGDTIATARLHHDGSSVGSTSAFAVYPEYGMVVSVMANRSVAGREPLLQPHADALAEIFAIEVEQRAR